MNGMNYETIPLPDTIDELFDFMMKQTKLPVERK
jgi:hypothetical protein